MKKVLLTLVALLLAFAMCFSIVGCDKDDDDKRSRKDKDDKKTSVSDKVDNDDEIEETTAEEEEEEELVDAKKDPVEEYIEANKDFMTEAIESSFDGCTAEVYAKNSGIVVELYMDSFNDFTDEQRQAVQDGYDSAETQEYYQSLLESMQSEVPEIEYIKYEVYDGNGDYIATAGAGF